jgi:peptide/histidine transporter 3/4
MLLLTLSASLPSLRPKHANENATSGELAVFYLALYLIALGTGGIKPCVSSFGADQFDDNDPKEKKRKTSFFNWFYFSINVGALIASSILVWIQTNIGWGWGFGIPTVAMGLAIGTFFFGTSLYRHQKPGGSPLTRIIQVLYAAIRKWRVPVGKDHTTLYELQDHESGIEGSRMLEHTPAFQ